MSTHDTVPSKDPSQTAERACLEAEQTSGMLASILGQILCAVLPVYEVAPHLSLIIRELSGSAKSGEPILWHERHYSSPIAL